MVIMPGCPVNRLRLKELFEDSLRNRVTWLVNDYVKPIPAVHRVRDLKISHAKAADKDKDFILLIFRLYLPDGQLDRVVRVGIASWEDLLLVEEVFFKEVLPRL